jgi:hypothetical protein
MVSSIKNGIKYKWVNGRIVGLLVAIFIAPLYWIIQAFDGFK